MDNFKARFDDFALGRQLLLFIQNPFLVTNVTEFSEEAKQTFRWVNVASLQMELQENVALREQVGDCDPVTFWGKMVPAAGFPVLNKMALHILTMSGSTYCYNKQYWLMCCLNGVVATSGQMQEAKHTEFSQKESDFRICDETSCKFGGVCKEEGGDVKCACQFQCHKNYIPVCGSNGDTYQNECYLRQASCKHQKHISVLSEGPCYPEYEGSGADVSRKFTKCGTCKYGAECDEDSEDVWCICNIDCSGHNENPVCATDGDSYKNPCLVREASCLKQEQIDVKHLGKCPDAGDQGEDSYGGYPEACSENYIGFCKHGNCEFKYDEPSCRCDSGYKGAQCDETQDFNILYVVPSGQKLHYVLIAAIIGAVQIAIIVAVVMCITRWQHRFAYRVSHGNVKDFCFTPWNVLFIGNTHNFTSVQATYNT
ncbi:UNVERIFIED_CONTAM: hypothetical protein FKN15_041271 [Acipenser sinensis]